MPAALVPSRVSKPKDANSSVRAAAAPSTPDALATFTMPGWVTSGSVVVVGGSVVVVDVVVDVDVMDVVEDVVVVAVVVVMAERSLLQASGTSVTAARTRQRAASER